MDFNMLAVSILSWTWHIKLQTLPVEHLIVVESRRCFIEANVLAGEDLVVGGAALRRPLCPRVLEVVLNLVGSCAELLRALQHLLRVILVKGCHFALDL